MRAARRPREGGVRRTANARPEALAFFAPLVLCAASWAGGGIPALTDVGFAALTALTLWLLARELLEFDRRRSIARIVLYAGVLVWFCQDYLENWFNHDFPREASYPADLIARVATMHCLFVLGMAVATTSRGSWLARAEALVGQIPEPRSRSTYTNLVVGLAVVGLVPYAFFTRDPFLETIYNSMTGFYAHGPRFTFGRTGNLNYDWSGYLFELIKLGRFGGLLAGFYAVLIAPTPMTRRLGWAVWTFWTLMAFGSGTRGELVAMTMPIVVLMFLRHHRGALSVMRRHPRRVPAGVVALSALVFLMIQIQGHLRSAGFSQESFKSVEFTELRGNHMFSEGLAGWSRVPDHRPPFFDTWPGEGALRAIPEFLFRIVVHPIPRALWRDKPVDPVWAWHNTLAVGTGLEGTTVSTGLVGWWYLRFGAIGMLEGAVVMGLLLAMAERCVLAALAARRFMALLVSLGLVTWVFRCFRDVAIGELWGVLVAAIAVSALIRLMGAK